MRLEVEVTQSKYVCHEFASPLCDWRGSDAVVIVIRRMNVVTVGAKYTTLGYLFQDCLPTTLSIVGYVEYLSGRVDVIKGEGCRMMVVSTFLTAFIQFIRSNEGSFLCVVFLLFPKVIFVSGQVS
jgi:hypothetical protein